MCTFLRIFYKNIKILMQERKGDNAKFATSYFEPDIIFRKLKLQ